MLVNIDDDSDGEDSAHGTDGSYIDAFGSTLTVLVMLTVTVKEKAIW